jgi:hypothetical protein
VYNANSHSSEKQKRSGRCEHEEEVEEEARILNE